MEMWPTVNTILGDDEVGNVNQHRHVSYPQY